MSLYPRLAASSLRLLTKYGQSVTLRQYSVGGGDYSPATGGAIPTGVLGQNDSIRRGLIVDAPSNRISQKFGQTIEKNSLIQDNDKWMYLDPIGARPSLQDHIITSMLEYSIVDIQEINPAGTPVLFMLVLRA